MSEPEKIFVFGAGGHAKLVIDAIEREGLHVIAWVFQAHRKHMHAKGLTLATC